MRLFDFTVGIITGFIVGSATGILFAPQRGSETRKTIAKTAIDVKGSAADLLQEGLNAIEAATGLFGGDKEKVIKKKIQDLKTELESFDIA